MVRSDHRALSFFRTQPVLNDMLIGWADIMLNYNFDVEYVPGPSNVIPDELSRLDYPLPERPSLEAVSSSQPGILRRMTSDLNFPVDELKAYASVALETDKVDPSEELS